MSVDNGVGPARAAIKAVTRLRQRRLLDEADHTEPFVLEALAQVSYLELDFPSAIELWEAAYPGYRQDAAIDRGGAVRPYVGGDVLPGDR
jgi:hypothetical protein